MNVASTNTNTHMLLITRTQNARIQRLLYTSVDVNKSNEAAKNEWDKSRDGRMV